MRTIQDLFRSAERDSLIRGYIYEHPFNIDSDKGKDFESVRNLTLGEVYDRYYKKVNGLIDKICNIEVRDTNMIFFAHHIEDSGMSDIGYSLVKIDELMAGNPVSYAYEFSPIEETAGYYVAETYLTDRELYDFLHSYINVTSFFGYDQERLEAEKAKLDEAMRDYEAHKDDPDYFISEEDLFKEFEEAFGATREVREELEENAWKNVVKTVAEYNKLAFDIEADKVRQSLVGEMHE